MEKKIFLFILSILLLIPISIYAKDYNAFDIRFEEELGTNVKNNEIKVFAAVDGDENLTDRTEDFTMEDVRWYKYVSTMNEGETEENYDYFDAEKNIYGSLVNDDDVFDENYEYFLYIGRLYAQEEDSFSRNVKINGVDIDELDGLCFNTGNEFFIKTISRGDTQTVAEDEVEEVEIVEPVEEVETAEVVDEPFENVVENTCPCGMKCCCMKFLGLPICIWILILIILIIVIILLAKKRKKNK